MTKKNDQVSAFDQGGGFTKSDIALKPAQDLPGTSTGGYGAPNKHGVVTNQLEPNKTT